MLSQPVNNIQKSVIGYMVNASVSSQSQNKIASIQKELLSSADEALWVQPPESLHITLLDWVAPLVEYGADKDALFRANESMYDIAVTDALAGIGTIQLEFTDLIVTESAVILKTKDSSALNSIRNTILDSVDLIPNTKQPPSITHISIARFVKQITIDELSLKAKELECSFTEVINEFLLVRETLTPMLEREVIKEYQLVSKA